jgi:hypothetical protein
MATIREAYKKYQSKQLLEARVSLLQKGVYPFDVFLKESTEAVNAAEKIEQLEEVASKYKTQAPTLYVLVQQNSAVLLEGKASPAAIKATMINYAFICEALNKCVNEVVKLMSSKVASNQSLHGVFNHDSAQLLEFAIKKSQAYKLVEGNADQVIKSLSLELSKMPFSNLQQLCESTPTMRLYVANTVHTQLVKTVLGG